MIFNKRKSICGSEIDNIAGPVILHVPRFMQSTLNEPDIPDTRSAAVRADLKIMNRQNSLQFYPFDHHLFASSLRISLSSRMISSAAAICFEKFSL